MSALFCTSAISRRSPATTTWASVTVRSSSRWRRISRRNQRNQPTETNSSRAACTMLARMSAQRCADSTRTPRTRAGVAQLDQVARHCGCWTRRRRAARAGRSGRHRCRSSAAIALRSSAGSGFGAVEHRGHPHLGRVLGVHAVVGVVDAGEQEELPEHHDQRHHAPWQRLGRARATATASCVHPPWPGAPGHGPRVRRQRAATAAKAANWSMPHGSTEVSRRSPALAPPPPSASTALPGPCRAAPGRRQGEGMRALLGTVGLSIALLLTGAAPGSARAVHEPTWRAVDVGTTQQFRGLDAVNRTWPGSAAAPAACGGRRTAARTGRTSARPAPPGCCSATSRPPTPGTRRCSRSARATRAGSTAPPTAARPGSRRSPTTTRPRSTTAWRSGPAAATASR